MTLVNGTWYDNVIGKTKNYLGKESNHTHQFGMGENSENIPIVICTICNDSRMYIILMQKDKREGFE